MNKYILMSDSCVDLNAKLAKELELEIIPLSVEVKGKTYFNYLDEREITFKNFYNELRNNVVTTTSMINPDAFVNFMEPFLKDGYDILYIGFSSALSGTYNSSLIAKEELSSVYPDRKIIAVDSLCASMGQGLLLTYASHLKKAGKSIEEVAKFAEDTKQDICHLFTVGDLNHLRRGGRLSYAKAFLGTMLKIKPLLHVNKEGKLVQTGSTRGRKQSLNKMIERMKETIDNPKDQVVYISHGDCLEEVLEMKREIIKELNVKEVVINYIGPVIGSHSGLGTVAIFYLGNDRSLPYAK